MVRAVELRFLKTSLISIVSFLTHRFGVNDVSLSISDFFIDEGRNVSFGRITNLIEYQENRLKVNCVNKNVQPENDSEGSH